MKYLLEWQGMKTVVGCDLVDLDGTFSRLVVVGWFSLAPLGTKKIQEFRTPCSLSEPLLSLLLSQDLNLHAHEVIRRSELETTGFCITQYKCKLQPLPLSLCLSVSVNLSLPPSLPPTLPA